MGSHTWARLANFKNPIINKALTSLPGIVSASRTTNTIKSYIAAYDRYERWAADIEELSVYPANDLAVTIYLLSMIQMGRSISVLNQFVFATSWIHGIGGYPNPTHSILVKTVLEGAKRKLSSPTTRNEPITPSILRKLKRSFSDKKGKMELKNNRLLTFMVLAYAGFLRCQEALQIRRSDIAFHSSYVAIFLEKSKYRQGRTVMITRTGTPMDPVCMLYRYLLAANIPVNSDKYIFRGLRFDKFSGKTCLRTSDKPISYSTVRDEIRSALTAVGLDCSMSGTHSLRAGGAMAAANQGVPERLFRIHGRWQSDDSKDRYVKESIRRRLKVTLNLGL